LSTLKIAGTFPVLPDCGTGAGDAERAMRRQLWTEDKNAKLRNLASSKPLADVAAEMGESTSSRAMAM
jgi:hypothetical protein